MRFFIQHGNAGRVNKLEGETKSLQAQVTEALNQTKAAMKKGETALNRADEAKKLCAKK